MKGGVGAFENVAKYLESIGKYEGGVLKGKDFAEKGFGGMQEFSMKDLTKDQMSELLYIMKTSGMENISEFQERGEHREGKQQTNALKLFIENARANEKTREKMQVRIEKLQETVQKVRDEFEPGIRTQVEKEIMEKVKNYQYGGEVDYTGLAMVHGSKEKPEIMFDNIQVNRMEALLTMGERDRGGGGSNDFSTQNVDSRRITSTVTNIAAPQKHLFGVQEQRFGLA